MMTNRLLESLEIPIGGQIVLYNVAARKIQFFIRNKDGYRLKQTRSKRKKPTNVRSTDFVVKLEYNGNVVMGAENIPEVCVV